MEEMVQALFEEGVLQRNGAVKLVRALAAIKVPATVQAVLATRIDRLSATEKELLQTLAVLGHEFSLNLVQLVWQHPLPRVTALAKQQTSAAPLALSRNEAGKGHSELEQMLSHLQLGEFIYEQPAVGGVEYSFKHALTQEVAYNSLLTERRRALHERTGRAIEELYPDQLEDHYSDLARHFLGGTDAAKAIRYAQLATEQALSRGAYLEASNLVKAALKLLDRLPDRTEGLRAELPLRSHESVLASVLYGGASPEREQVIRRVCELSEAIGETDHLLRGMITLSNFYFLRGESVRGLEVATRCLRLAEATGDPSLLAEAHYAVANLNRSCGNLRQAVSHFEAALLHTNRTECRISLGGISVPAMIGSSRAAALQLLGRVTEALTVAEDAQKCARESKHLFSLGFALIMRALIYRYRGEPGTVLLCAKEAMALAEENGFTGWRHLGQFWHGWSLVQLGQPDQGIAEMEGGFVGLGRGVPHIWAGLLAYSYASAGRIDEALSLLDEALAKIKDTGAKLELPETLRIKGEVLLMRDRKATDDAEACLRSALHEARMQEAKWWELRT